MIFISSKDKYLYSQKGDHTEYINNYGFSVPSVTTILKVINKDALLYWANSLGWKKISVKNELDRTASIGTYAHEYIENYITNQISVCDNIEKEYNNSLTYSDRIEVEHSINSFKKYWLKNSNHFKIIDCEHKFVTSSYGGTCDLIAEYDGDLCIFDFKTSKAFHFSMFLQLAAYWKAYYLEYNIFPKKVAIIKLDKKAGEEAKILWNTDLQTENIEFYCQCFDDALTLYNSIYRLEEDWKSVKD